LIGREHDLTGLQHGSERYADPLGTAAHDHQDRNIAHLSSGPLRKPRSG
jgi:hypothetical protein